MLDRLSGRTASQIVLAFVDDTYLLDVSSSYKQNCRILKSLHNTIMGWAGESGVTFGPEKYALLHFQRSGSRHQEWSDVLDIHGLTENCLRTELRVLGVWLDSRLTWRRHIEHVSPTYKKTSDSADQKS